MARKRDSTVHTVCGWIVRGRDGDYSEALYLIDHRPTKDKWGRLKTEPFEPLAKRVYELASYGRRTVSVSYHITDGPLNADQLTELLIAKLSGVSLAGDHDIEYFHRYSDLTGYLWTNEKLQIGGHDLIKELSTYLGKWCHLIIKLD